VAARGNDPSVGDGGRPSSRLGRLGRILSANVSVIVCAFTLVYAQPYFERLNNPNELTRVYTTMAIVDHGTYAIDALSPGKYGFVEDRSVVGGRHYACKAPGTSFVGVPAYAALRAAFALFGKQPSLRTTVLTLRVACIAVPFLLFLVLLRSYLDERYGRGWIPDASVLACGLGTMLFPYAHLFAGHVLAAVSLGSAFILLDRAVGRLETSRPYLIHLLAGGLLLGSAPTFEYPAALGAAVVGVWALARLGWRIRPLLFLAASTAVALVPTIHFHWSVFGGPLTTPYPFVEDPVFRHWHETGWLGLTYPRPDRMCPALFSAECGLFFLAPALLPWLGLLAALPVLVLGLVPSIWRLPWWAILLIVTAAAVLQVPAWRFARRRRWVDGRTVVAALVPVLLALYVASSEMWRSGWSFGLRFFATAIPFLVLGAAAVLHRAGAARRPEVRAAFGGLLLGSCAAHLLAGVLYPHIPNGIRGPLPEFLLPLVHAGLSPASWASACGVQGGWFWIPLVVVVGAGFVIVASRGVRGAATRIRDAALAVGLGCLVFAG
jgi:hypothetical protein